MPGSYEPQLDMDSSLNLREMIVVQLSPGAERSEGASRGAAPFLLCAQSPSYDHPQLRTTEER